MSQNKFAIPYGWPLYFIKECGPARIALARKGQTLELWVGNPQLQLNDHHFPFIRQGIHVYANAYGTFWYVTSFPENIPDNAENEALNRIISEEGSIISTISKSYLFDSYCSLYKQQMLHGLFWRGDDVTSGSFLEMLDRCKFVKNYKKNEPSLMSTLRGWYLINKYGRSMFWVPEQGILDARPNSTLEHLSRLLIRALDAEQKLSIEMAYRADKISGTQFLRLLAFYNLWHKLSPETRNWVSSWNCDWNMGGWNIPQDPKPRVKDEIQEVQSALAMQLTGMWPNFVPGFGIYLG